MTRSICILMCCCTAAAVLAQQPDPSQRAEEIRRQIEQQRGKPTTRPAAEDRAQAQARELIRRGAQYLLAAQGPDGGWDEQTGPGISALVLKALIQEPSVGPDHPAVRRGIDFLRRFQRDDGGIYGAEGLHKNYESSVALSAFAVLPEGRNAKEVEDLRRFLKENQWDEGEDKSKEDVWYGGAGYGRGQRPDLSNTQMMLEALHDSGLPPSDPAYQKALVFIERCQMLGETNDQPFAKGSTQGGFIYSPANNGESKAGYLEKDGDRELRCYGSMTYAGLKSMLYAGLKRDDPRVKAALDWIGEHWTLDHNPNMPGEKSKEGLFYFYHVFGRTFEAWGEPVIRDKSGRAHNWRAELTDKLAGLQRRDGSWANEADRWMEGRPPLTTAYSMLALQATLAKDRP